MTAPWWSAGAERVVGELFEGQLLASGWVTGGEQAAGVLAQVRRGQIEGAGDTWSDAEEQAFKQPILDDFAAQSHPYYASARLWDDGIIDPTQSRRVLGLALSATLNRPIDETRFGVFRM